MDVDMLLDWYEKEWVDVMTLGYERVTGGIGSTRLGDSNINYS